LVSKNWPCQNFDNAGGVKANKIKHLRRTLLARLLQPLGSFTTKNKKDLMELYSDDYYTSLIQSRNQLAKELATKVTIKRTKSKTKSLKQLIADATSTEQVEHILKTFGLKG